MKRLSLVTLSILIASTGAQAQLIAPSGIRPTTHIDATSNLTTDDKSFLSLVLNRIQKLDVGTNIGTMKHNGVNQASFQATFTAEGALIQDSELHARSASVDSDRDAGTMILRYNLSIDSEGKVGLGADLLSFRKMVAKQAGQDNYLSGGIFSVVDNLDFLAVNLDDGYSYRGQKTFSIKFVDTDLKIPLTGNTAKARYLAISLGGSIGMSRSTITLDSGETIHIGRTAPSEKNSPGMNLEEAGRAGLTFHDQSLSGSRLDVSVLAEKTYTAGRFRDPVLVAQVNETNARNQKAYDSALTQYQADNLRYTSLINQYHTALSQYQTKFSQYQSSYSHYVSAYQTAKAAYAKTHCGKVLTEAQFQQTSKLCKPVPPGKPKAPTETPPVTPTKEKDATSHDDRVSRSHFFIAVPFEYSRVLGNTKGHSQTNSTIIGIRGEVDLNVSDVLQGGRLGENMAAYNRRFVTIGAFIKFK